MTDPCTSTTGPIVLLDDSRQRSGRGGLLFRDPAEVIVAHSLDEASAALDRLDRALRAGHWVAGWIAYEVGAALEPGLARRDRLSEEPLIWLAVCDRPRRLSPSEVPDFLAAMAQDRSARIASRHFEWSEAEYVAAVERVQGHIVAGDVYQINLTFPGGFRLHGHPAALYAELRRAQPTAFSALIDTGSHWVLSASPELFVRSDNGVLSAAPMKGTAPRHPLADADRRVRDDLAADRKNRAENLMIVDLLRNDLSRISEPGSVRVEKLFEIETYPTVHQMISRITARRTGGATATDIIKALFPCGSITGAPKIRAMDIITAIESAPRGVYTGAIGYFAPDGDLCLNVPIRTAVVDRSGWGRFHVGAGIVADSDPASEYRESVLKARFLLDRPVDFALLETMRWDPNDGYWLVDRHLARMAASAAYFDFPFVEEDVRRELAAVAAHFTQAPQRVRILLDRHGAIAIEAATLEANTDAPVRLALCPDAVDTDDPFIYHKTTRRQVYDQRLQAMRTDKSIDDIILVNRSGYITETTISNIFLRFGDRLLTPPRHCGLIAGTYRDHLLDNPPAGASYEESLLAVDDCYRADAIYVVNSVRGMRLAHLVE